MENIVDLDAKRKQKQLTVVDFVSKDIDLFVGESIEHLVEKGMKEKWAEKDVMNILSDLVMALEIKNERL